MLPIHVEVWIASRLLARQKTTFSKKELGDTVRNTAFPKVPSLASLSASVAGIDLVSGGPTVLGIDLSWTGSGDPFHVNALTRIVDREPRAPHSGERIRPGIDRRWNECWLGRADLAGGRPNPAHRPRQPRLLKRRGTRRELSAHSPGPQTGRGWGDPSTYCASTLGLFSSLGWVSSLGLNSSLGYGLGHPNVWSIVRIRSTAS